MNKIFYLILTSVLICSCAESYNIVGSSAISDLDGRMLYLKIIKDNDLKNLDSCDVVHGKFHFTGTMDSVRMANLFMDDESVMPLVIEKGEISISLDNTQQKVGGTPLNDALYKFIEEHKQLDSEMAELTHKHDQAIMDGADMGPVIMKLNKEADEIAEKEDKLVTSFIVDNFDNVLGPGVFMMITSAYQYPILNPWIEDIMSKATSKFKNDPYVKTYYQMAQENEARMNGMEPMTTEQRPTPPPPPAMNEMQQDTVMP